MSRVTVSQLVEADKQVCHRLRQAASHRLRLLAPGLGPVCSPAIPSHVAPMSRHVSPESFAWASGHYCPEEWEDTRIVLAAYSVRGRDKLPSNERRPLRDAGFHLEAAELAGASVVDVQGP